MQVYKTYKYRVYPTKEQTTLINKTIGCTRFVFNALLAEWKNCYAHTKRGLSYADCQAELIKLKQSKTSEWLNEVDSLALDYSVKQLFVDYIGFFRKERPEPRFKRKLAIQQTYHTRNDDNSIAIVGKRIKLPVIGLLRKRDRRPLFAGRIISATMIKSASRHYYVAILVKTEVESLPLTGSNIGIDLGLYSFATLSNGQKIDNCRFLQLASAKLAKAQKILSRRALRAKAAGKKLVECMNYQKQRCKVARIYEKIANKRQYFLQKISSEIIKNHDLICVEDLSGKQLMQNHRLAKSIADAAWNDFVIMLEYKAKWYGRRLIKVCRWLPSTQLCSNCGYRSGKKELNIRTWKCSACGTLHDRDLNASRNILNAGLKLA